METGRARVIGRPMGRESDNKFRDNGPQRPSITTARGPRIIIAIIVTVQLLTGRNVTESFLDAVLHVGRWRRSRRIQFVVCVRRRSMFVHHSKLAPVFFLNKNKKKGEENGPRNVFNQPAGHPVGTRTDDDDDTGPSLSVAP